MPGVRGSVSVRSHFLLALLCAVAVAIVATADAELGTQSAIAPNGRQLDPVGRMTALGAFPTGGALSPDGRFYWAVDAGRGVNAVRIIEMESGEIRQTLPIPGGYVGVGFAPDGKRAYVSGEPADAPQPAGAKGVGGDVIHVFKVDPDDGAASELAPISIPSESRDGAASQDELPPASGVNAWPVGLAVTPDGKRLVVALGQADQTAIIDVSNGKGKLARVGRYPYGVAIDPDRDRAYVTNERDGTVSVVGISDGKVIATIPIGGPALAGYPHPQGLAVDPTRHRLYVAVTDRDMVSVIDTDSLKVVRTIDVSRKGAAIGSAPINVGVAPDGETLYVANAGEDAIVAIALTDRPRLDQLRDRGRFPLPRSVRAIGRYRAGLARERARRERAGDSGRAGHESEKAFHERVRRLKRLYLRGKLKPGCGGPTISQDRRYGRAVLHAYGRRASALRAARRQRDPGRRKAAIRRAQRRFVEATDKARVRLPRFQPCVPGSIPGTVAFETLGRLPTAAYPTDVEVTPDGKQLVWLAAKGLGPDTPDGESIRGQLKGRAGVLPRPTDQEMATFTARADKAVVPTNAEFPPVGTPLVGPNGGPSTQIKHVFYIVRENRTYDQIFGSDPRGDGDPNLELFDDNGVPGPAGGITPNAHALSRKFSLLDHVFANSEESTTGHKITAGGYVNDYTTRYSFANRGRKGNPDLFPVGIPPNGFIFDQAVRQSVPFHVYGELGAGNQPFANDGRPTYPEVQANTDATYPSQFQGTCGGPNTYPPGTPNTTRCTADAGAVPPTAGAPAVSSRVNTFQAQFQSQLASGTVPALSYLILFNDHTDGTTPGDYTPRADLADNDLALGQVVQLVSQSSIWQSSAIFVVEDDSQDGADHVDAHRMPAFVISPYAKTGGQVISNRYDHYSFLRTIELILGLQPLSINDALATPLYDAFLSGGEQPDVDGTRYTAIQPQVSLTEVNPANAPDADLSRALPFHQTDLVPQRLMDQILWHSIYGADSTPPGPGPGHSPIERARAVGAMMRYRNGRNVTRYLKNLEEGEDEGRHSVTTGILIAGAGMSREEAMAQVGEGGDDQDSAEPDDAESEETDPDG